MRRIIVLNNENYPADFRNISVSPPEGTSKEVYVELAIIDSINKYNPKLNIEGIEYAKIERQFLNYKKGVHNGVIIEEEIIDESKRLYFENSGYYVFNDSGKIIARRILMYLFLSDTSEDSRNQFVSQTIFPTLVDHMEDSIPTSTYTISDHDFCFIYIGSKPITANTILRHVASLNKIGIHFVQVFINSIDVEKIPQNMKQFLQQYDSDYDKRYLVESDTYDGLNYRVRFSNKEFFIKTDTIRAKLVSRNNHVDFHGSDEKFYWVEILPMCIMAYKEGYAIDYSEYEDFINKYKTQFSVRSKKILRCEILLKYFKKYFV